MWFRSLFATLLARTCRTRSWKTRLAPSYRRRPRFLRPRLEILEDRTLLSTYTVNSLTDTGTGSGLAGDLRYCISHATSGNDTITFAQGLTGTINLESALPALNTNVAIQGPGAAALTVERDPSLFNSFAFFAVGRTATVEISGLSILGNAITNAGTLNISACIGGDITNSGTANLSNFTIDGERYAFAAIVNTGTMTVSHSSISNTPSGPITNSGVMTLNFCTLSQCGKYIPLGPNFATGGAIFNQGALTINNCTLNSDEAYGGTSGAVNGMGGAIYMSAGTLSINSSTLADNSAVGDGGGPGTSGGGGGGNANGYGGGLYIAGGTVSINNSTIAGNAAEGNIGYGGGIYNAVGPGALQMYDTILADNSAATPDLDGSVSSLGHNLIGDSTGGSGFLASDLLNVDPQLGPLQYNGGPTQTMALLPGSPAINAGDNKNAPAYDQRGPGFPRFLGSTIDIGAFEVHPHTFSVSGFPTGITAGSAGTFTVAVLNANGSTDTSYTGTVHFTSSDPQAVLPANYTFTAADKGVHTFTATLKTAGSQSITADTATGSITGTETSIVVKPAAASQFILSAPSSVTHRTKFSVTLTVEDAYGNVVTGYTGTVHFTSSDKQATLPANYTFTTADAGKHTFTSAFILRTRGKQTLTATDTQNSGLTATDSISVL